MGIKITNMTEVVTMFQLTEKRVTEEARSVLRRYAEKVKNDAVAFAPVDEHNLEKAIKVLPSQGNQYTLRMTIAVGGVVGGRNVDEYAAIVHEYQWSKRGPYTRLKGPKAGPRYLKRAVEANEKGLKADLAKAMQKGIDTAIRQSGVNKRARRR
ncbi:hypothetical protein [Xanthomonas phage JGB6]|nr:hypothetical protein [Xanthomonas phage JGB6]